MENLSPRQQSILNRIIETYIETAQPVGSRSLTEIYTEIYRASYSPATVRAEMGQLEEKGYLTHPHTSAGRIPTDRGYRYYVDHALKEEKLNEEELRKAARELSSVVKALSDFAELASQILSQLTQELSLVVVREDESENARLFVRGSNRILEKPEFQDVRKAQPVFRTLEEKSRVAEWLSRRNASELSITIGQENDQESFQDCTVISTHYRLRGRNFGTLAVLGPRRMPYGKTVSAVQAMGKIIKSILENSEESSGV